MNVTHTEVVEFRQRVARLQMKRGDAQEEEIKLRRFLNGLATKYQVLGLRHQIDPDTGEIVIFAEPGQAPTLAQAMDALEGNQWEPEPAGPNLAVDALALLEENGVPADHALRLLLETHWKAKGLL
jgi:hypothetical protein